MNIPNRIWINPEYGKPYSATVLRTHNNNTVAIVHPDGLDSMDTRKIDLESTSWASLDDPIEIPDNITAEEDYLYYQAISKEHSG